jgi:hypothetical protein
MHSVVTPHLSPSARFAQSHLAVAQRRTVARSTFMQLETKRTDDGTTGANVLILDSLPYEQLHLLPAAIATFLLRHARRGHCPAIPALRRLGFRTRSELESRQA